MLPNLCKVKEAHYEEECFSGVGGGFDGLGSQLSNNTPSAVAETDLRIMRRKQLTDGVQRYYNHFFSIWQPYRRHCKAQ